MTYHFDTGRANQQPIYFFTRRIVTTKLPIGSCSKRTKVNRETRRRCAVTIVRVGAADSMQVALNLTPRPCERYKCAFSCISGVPCYARSLREADVTGNIRQSATCANALNKSWRFPMPVPFVVTPGNAPSPLKLVGEQITVLASGAQTGSYEIFLQAGPESSGPPPHNHPWDESFYVIKGEIAFGILASSRVLRPAAIPRSQNNSAQTMVHRLESPL